MHCSQTRWCGPNLLSKVCWTWWSWYLFHTCGGNKGMSRFSKFYFGWTRLSRQVAVLFVLYSPQRCGVMESLSCQFVWAHHCNALEVCFGAIISKSQKWWKIVFVGFRCFCRATVPSMFCPNCWRCGRLRSTREKLHIILCAWTPCLPISWRCAHSDVMSWYEVFFCCREVDTVTGCVLCS